MRQTRLGSNGDPDDKGEDGDEEDGGDEERRDAIGETLNGSAGTLGLPDHLDDLGEQGIGPDAPGLHDEAAGAVDGSTGNSSAWKFLDGDGLSGDHGFVDGASAFEDRAVDGDFFTGSNAEPVSHLHLGQWQVRFVSIGLQAASSFGG